MDIVIESAYCNVQTSARSKGGPTKNLLQYTDDAFKSILSRSCPALLLSDRLDRLLSLSEFPSLHAGPT